VDVAVPPATWVDRGPPPPRVAREQDEEEEEEEDAGRPVRQRLQFGDMASGAASPAFTGRQAAPEPSDRNLRPVVRPSVAFELAASSVSVVPEAEPLGESFSTGISVTDPRIHKVLAVLFTERRVLDAYRRENGGEIRIPSPVADKAPLTTTLGGIEHASFDLALQGMRDLLAAACNRLRGRCLQDDSEVFAVAAELAMLLDDWELGSIVSDALSSAPNSVKKTFPDAHHFIDWWHRRTTWKKEVQKAEAKKKDKKALFPGFDGAAEALGNVFSDCVFAKMPYEAFAAEVDRLLQSSGVDVYKDKDHRTAWAKVMAKGEKMYAQTSVEKGSGVNELFHAHLRFFCLKGDAMSTAHWKIVVCFAFLSFNNFPEWQKRVTDEFLKLRE
jgi:hypothetical protein